MDGKVKGGVLEKNLRILAQCMPNVHFVRRFCIVLIDFVGTITKRKREKERERERKRVREREGREREREERKI